MRTFLLAIFISGMTPCFGAFSFQRLVAVNHLKVPNTNYAGPVLVSGTYAYLATVANGGKVQHASGFDIIFSSNAACTGLLPFEVETWSAVTGLIVAKVNAGTILTASDSPFYICYGDATVSTDLSNRNAVYDANTVQAWSLASTTVSSSTSSPIALTNTAATAVAGQVDGALAFNGTTAHLASASAITLGSPAVVTVEFWLNWTSFANGVRVLMEMNSNFVSANGCLLMVPNDATGSFFISYGSDVSAGQFTSVLFARPSAAAWHHYVVVVNTASPTAVGTIIVYLDGVAVSLTPGANFSIPTQPFSDQIWNFMSRGGSSLFGDGILDNLQISKVGRSADWAATRYNNSFDPSTFYTIGSEQAPSVGTATLRPKVIAQ
jgi:hypothetical protein